MKEGREGASLYLEEEGLARQQRALKATKTHATTPSRTHKSHLAQSHTHLKMPPRPRLPSIVTPELAANRKHSRSRRIYGAAWDLPAGVAWRSMGDLGGRAKVRARRVRAAKRALVQRAYTAQFPRSAAGFT